MSIMCCAPSLPLTAWASALRPLLSQLSVIQTVTNSEHGAGATSSESLMGGQQQQVRAQNMRSIDHFSYVDLLPRFAPCLLSLGNDTFSFINKKNLMIELSV